MLQRHTNGAGIAHGGMTMLFADVILGTAAFYAMNAPCATVRLLTDFVGSPRVGDWVEGHCRVLSVQDDLVHLDARIYVGDQTIATIMSIFKKMKLRPAAKS